MKSSLKSVLFTSALAIITINTLFAQSSNVGFEQWHRAKFGRPSPSEQARLNTQPVNAPSANAAAVMSAESANSGFEQRYRMKTGRPTPAIEASLMSQQPGPADSSAAQPAIAVTIDSGFERRYEAKYGRLSPTEEARLYKTPSTNDLEATAKTPADHLRIAKFYQSQAQHYIALAKEHESMLAQYKSTPGLTNDKTQAGTVNHCSYLVQKFNDLAARDNELAMLHARMATKAAKM